MNDYQYINENGIPRDYYEIVNENGELCKEIERLKKREQECIDHYLVQCKYASEMEDKYITANNIINELEKYLNNSEFRCPDDLYVSACDDTLNKLQELKGSE